jgi:hypothetical protein
MLKKYIDFIKESREDYDVPSHFVELNSIGCYLDPNEGKLYAMLANGGCDDEPYNVEDDLDGLSGDDITLAPFIAGDKRLIESFRISTEELLKDKINLDLTEDIMDRCISEGLVDENVYIDIRAMVRMYSYSLTAYKVYSKNNKIDYTWKKVFKDEADVLRSTEEKDIYYTCVFIYVKRYEADLKPKMDLIEKIIKQDYPNLQCTFLQLMDNYRTV